MGREGQLIRAGSASRGREAERRTSRKWELEGWSLWTESCVCTITTLQGLFRASGPAFLTVFLPLTVVATLLTRSLLYRGQDHGCVMLTAQLPTPTLFFLALSLTYHSL